MNRIIFSPDNVDKLAQNIPSFWHIPAVPLGCGGRKASPGFRSPVTGLRLPTAPVVARRRSRCGAWRPSGRLYLRPFGDPSGRSFNPLSCASCVRISLQFWSGVSRIRFAARSTWARPCFLAFPPSRWDWRIKIVGRASRFGTASTNNAEKLQNRTELPAKRRSKLAVQL